MRILTFHLEVVQRKREVEVEKLHDHITELQDNVDKLFIENKNWKKGEGKRVSYRGNHRLPQLCSH